MIKNERERIENELHSQKDEFFKKIDRFLKDIDALKQYETKYDNDEANEKLEQY
jgi:hypothetical protein